MTQSKPSGVAAPTVGLLVIASIAAGFFLGRATGPEDAATKGATAPTTVAVAKNTTTETRKIAAAQRDSSPFKGAKDATVIIYDISDFQ